MYDLRRLEGTPFAASFPHVLMRRVRTFFRPARDFARNNPMQSTFAVLLHLKSMRCEA
jgi:hypothetical protein